MKLIQDITSSVWMLADSSVQGLLPLFNSLVRGETVDFSMHSVHSEMSAFEDANIKTDKKVLVIPIHGVIMKYDYCGDMGMVTFESILQQLKSDESIGAIVLDIDSGGGQAAYLEHVATAMRELRDIKPVLVHVSGYCASAAYYIASQSTKIFCSSILDHVGSIGTMCTLNKKNPNSTEGYEAVQFYASGSVDKNIEYREAVEGNPTKIIADLDKYNAEFISNVKKGRPDIDPEAFTGVLVYSDKAIEMNLIDGIKRLDDVIKEAFSLIQQP
jgi:ClpP class serine protease